MNYESIIDRYITEQRHKWSETSIKSERSRLVGCRALLERNATPNQVLDVYLTRNRGERSLYSAKTLLVRISTLYTWMEKQGLRSGPNLFKEFLEKNYRFRNAYQKESINVTEEVAAEAIRQIRDGACRSWAAYMLATGLRPCEIHTVEAHGDAFIITGKQGKSRTVFVAPPKEGAPSYTQLQYELKKVGLKPKDLRKLFATKLANKGLNIKDVMEVMGWSAVQTANSYLQPKSQEELRRKIYGT